MYNIQLPSSLYPLTLFSRDTFSSSLCLLTSFKLQGQGEREHMTTGGCGLHDPLVGVVYL